MFDFTEKNVLVSGGTSGINLGIAESFANAGANVFVFRGIKTRLMRRLIF